MRPHRLLPPLCYALAKQSGRPMGSVAQERAGGTRAAPKPTSTGRKAA